MAVGANTYGSVARVSALVGDVVAARTFGAGTVPTVTEVEGILDDIASEINVELEGARYTLETASDLATNQPRVSDFLIALNSWGAAAAVLDTLPLISVAAGLDGAGEGGGRRDALNRRYLSGLKRIREKRLNATRSAIRVKVGSAVDDDGNVKKPIFTREGTTWPGTVSLVED